jgi:hypothetical protein
VIVDLTLAALVLVIAASAYDLGYRQGRIEGRFGPDAPSTSREGGAP